jgi:hypothetical protein
MGVQHPAPYALDNGSVLTARPRNSSLPKADWQLACGADAPQAEFRTAKAFGN